MLNGPSLPACTFTDRENLVFKSPAVKLEDENVSWAVWHRGQLPLLLWLSGLDGGEQTLNTCSLG